MAKGYVLMPVIRADSIRYKELYEYGVTCNSGEIACGFSTANPLQAVYSFKVSGGTAVQLTFDINNTYYIAHGNEGQSEVAIPSRVSISSRGTYNGVSYLSYNGSFILSTLSSFEPYDSLAEGVADILNSVYVSISYNSGAVGVAGPKFVLAGSEVTAYVTPPRGVTVAQDDITVTRAGTAIPFAYSNNVLTFNS